MSKKKILKNASYLFVSDVLLRLITAAMTILIARYLGAHDYGIISIALAFSAIAGYFTDIGLTQTLMREATKNGANIEVLLSSYLRSRLALAIITCIGSFLIIEIMYDDSFIKSTINWVVYPTIIGSALFGPAVAYFQVVEKMKVTAGLRFFQGTFTALMLFFAFIFKWPVNYVAPVYGFSYVVVGIVSLLILAREIKFIYGWNSEIIRGIVSFTLNGLVTMAIPQLGPLILERVTSLKDVGLFSAAYRIPVLLYQVPGVVAVAFYPRLFKLGNNNQLEEHLNLTAFQLKIMTLVILLVALPFLVYADWIINILFGDGWDESASVAAVLIFMVILQAIERPLADHLTTKDQQNQRTIIMIIGLIFATIAYFILGKEFGVMGGALAAVATELILVIMFISRIRKGITLVLRSIFINILCFFIAVAVTYLFFKGIFPIFGMIIGCILFIVLVFVLDKDIRTRGTALLNRKRVKEQN